MSPTQIKLLKEILRSKNFCISELPKEIQDDVWFLVSLKYVIHEEDVTSSDEYTGRIICKVTPAGRAALSQISRDNRHWVIPVIISIFAVIGAYRQEIAWLAQVLVKLLK